MNQSHFVRKMDELGRLVIPVELRRTLNIKTDDSLEVFVDGEYIMLKKYEPACIFCGNAKDVENIRGKNVCKDCLEEMKKL